MKLFESGSLLLLRRGHSPLSPQGGVVAFVNELRVLAHGDCRVVREELADAEVLQAVDHHVLAGADCVGDLLEGANP